MPKQTSSGKYYKNIDKNVNFAITIIGEMPIKKVKVDGATYFPYWGK